MGKRRKRGEKEEERCAGIETKLINRWRKIKADSGGNREELIIGKIGGILIYRERCWAGEESL